MTQEQELLQRLDACQPAREWAGDRSIEAIVAECERGDWLLWLAGKVGVELQPLTLAKGLCAQTVVHLMRDERSVAAVNAAVAFGKGEITQDALHQAAYAAYIGRAAAADAARVASAAARVAYAAADAARVASAAADAARVAVSAADAAYVAYAADAADAARASSQRQTARIVRETIGNLIVERCKHLME